MMAQKTEPEKLPIIKVWKPNKLH